MYSTRVKYFPACSKEYTSVWKGKLSFSPNFPPTRFFFARKGNFREAPFPEKRQPFVFKVEKERNFLGARGHREKHYSENEFWNIIRKPDDSSEFIMTYRVYSDKFELVRNPFDVAPACKDVFDCCMQFGEWKNWKEGGLSSVVIFWRIRSIL